MAKAHWILFIYLMCLIQLEVESQRRRKILSFPVAETVGSLKVKRGMSVFLHRSHFKIRVESEYCKIVISSDQFCKKVGTMSETVFPCHFESNQIKYTHNGSPLYRSDCVKFEIYIFTRRDTILQVTTLDVAIENTPEQFGLRSSSITVSKPGEITQITANQTLSKEFLSSAPGKSCFVQLNKQYGWPKTGELSRKRQILQELRTNCSDFFLAYHHDGSKLPTTDYLTFTLQFLPGPGMSELSINYFLPIKIRGALENSPPILLNRVSRLRITEYSLMILRPAHLQAVDYGSSARQLLIRIQRTTLTRGTGYIAHINHIEVPIRGFFQSDIDEGKIVFIAPKGISHRKILTIFFKAMDPYGLRSNTIHISILIVTKPKRHLTVLYNPGIYLLEGQTRYFSPVNLRLACNRRRCDRVNIDVWSGPQHGVLLKKGKSVSSFTYGDVNYRSVAYKHDDSETLIDSLILVASYMGEKTFFTISIKVEPKDDTPPALSTRRDITLKEGGSISLNDTVLNAVDTDSPSDAIHFQVIMPPSKGQLVRRYANKLNKEEPISDFSQRELSTNSILYKASRQKVGSDTFKFRVHDQARPPNYSGVYSFDIWINNVDTGKPYPTSNSKCHLITNETSKSLSLKNYLSYTDHDSVPKDITFKIIEGPTAYPTDLDTKIVYRWGINFHVRVQEFTQADLDYDKIYWNLGIEDVGSQKHIANFKFIASDAVGNQSPPSDCVLEILPVNNKPPTVRVLNDIFVKEGGQVCINSTHFIAEDKDTEMKDLFVSVSGLPAHGQVMLNERLIKAIDKISLYTLSKSCLVYKHYGNEKHQDDMQLMISDGKYQVNAYLVIHVNPIDDLPSGFAGNVSRHIDVEEKSKTILSTSIVRVIDIDTDDSNILIFVLDPPKFGTITVEGKVKDIFTQSQVNSNKVLYVHENTTGEEPQLHDVFTLGLCRKQLRDNDNQCISNKTIIVNVSIHPTLISQAVSFSEEILTVSEGGQANLTTEAISCRYQNGERYNGDLYIAQNATFGILRLAWAEEGSEIIRHRQIEHFVNCNDIRGQRILYVQNKHYNIEPKNDSIVFHIVAKGKKSVHKLLIQISPVNDESPKVITKKVTVKQGESVLLSRDYLNITDLDNNKNDIGIWLQTKPKCGFILYQCGSKKKNWLKLTAKLKVSFQGCALIYKHDGSTKKEDQLKIVASDGHHFTSARLNIDIIFKYGSLKIKNQKDININNIIPVKLSADILLCEVPGLDAKLLMYELLEPLLHGFLTHSQNPNKKEVITTFSQEDINNGNLFYKLKTWPKNLPATELIVLRVFGWQLKESKLSLGVKIHFPKETTLEVRTRTVFVFQGEKTTITSHYLTTRANNRSLELSNIRYRIVKDPAIGVLRIAGYHTNTIDKSRFFTQKDVDDGRLTFNVAQLHTTENKTDDFEFTVASGKMVSFGQVTVKILPKYKNSFLIRNTLLHANKGKLTLITPLELRAKENLDPNKVVYELFLEPKFGVFLLDGRRIMGAFTQQHINDLRVGYISIGTKGMKDEAVFGVKAQNNYGHTEQILFKFSIILKPVPSSKLKLVKHENITAIEELGSLGIGTLVSQRHLLAMTCNGTINEGIQFELKEGPKFGILLNISSSSQIKSSFHQEDIIKNRVVYVNLEKSEAFEDSFRFNSKFPNCPTLYGKELFIKWSIISLLKTRTNSCDGKITFTTQRKGFQKQIAIVDAIIYMKKPGVEALIDYQQKRLFFSVGSEYLVTEIKLRRKEISEDKVYIRLKNGFNTAIDTRRKEIEIKTESIFQNCCDKCKEKPPGRTSKKNVHKVLRPTKKHLLVELKLSPDRSPDMRPDEMGLRGSNEREVNFNDKMTRSKKDKINHCPPEWQEFKGNCYMAFSAKKRPWRKAAKICRLRMKAELSFPQTQEEEHWISKLSKGNIIWLGIRRNKRGQWLWSDGRHVKLNGKKLIDVNAQESGRARSLCGILHPDGQWSIKDCRSQRYSYVCKKSHS